VPTSYDEEERIYHKGFRDGWIAGSEMSTRVSQKTREVRKRSSPTSPKPKRKASAYSKRYGAAFRKVAPRFKKKNGSWKTDGFKKAQKAAHKLARK
jgi:hypothetical protein